jgi:hypothetical protein
VLNNPVRNTDLTGHCPWCVAAAIGAVVNVGFYVVTHQDSLTWGGAATAVLSGAVAGALMVTPIPFVGAIGGIGGAVAGTVVSMGLGIATDIAADTIGGGIDQALPSSLNGSGELEEGPTEKGIKQAGFIAASDAALVSRVTDIPSMLSVPKGTNVNSIEGIRKALFPRSRADAIRRGPSIQYNRTIVGRNIAASLLSAVVMEYVYDEVIEKSVSR